PPPVVDETVLVKGLDAFAACMRDGTDLTAWLAALAPRDPAGIHLSIGAGHRDPGARFHLGRVVRCSLVPGALAIDEALRNCSSVSIGDVVDLPSLDWALRRLGPATPIFLYVASRRRLDGTIAACRRSGLHV